MFIFFTPNAFMANYAETLDEQRRRDDAEKGTCRLGYFVTKWCRRDGLEIVSLGDDINTMLRSEILLVIVRYADELSRLATDGVESTFDNEASIDAAMRRALRRLGNSDSFDAAVWNQFDDYTPITTYGWPCVVVKFAAIVVLACEARLLSTKFDSTTHGRVMTEAVARISHDDRDWIADQRGGWKQFIGWCVEFRRRIPPPCKTGDGRIVDLGSKSWPSKVDVDVNNILWGYAKLSRLVADCRTKR